MRVFLDRRGRVRGYSTGLGGAWLLGMVWFAVWALGAFAYVLLWGAPRAIVRSRLPGSVRVLMLGGYVAGVVVLLIAASSARR